MQIQVILQDESSKPSFKDALDSRKMIVFSNLENTWDYVQFTTENTIGEDAPIIESLSWSPLELQSDQKHMDLKNLLFKSKDTINYYVCDCQVHCEFSLQGESTFWLFLRGGNSFTTNTAVITVSKREKSQNCYVSMGTFVEDIHKNLIYKIFTRQQLLDYSKKKSEMNIKKDIVHYKMDIIDKGEETISGTIYMNDSERGNKINSGFFIPVIEKYQVIIGGTGDDCLMKAGYAKAEFKEEYALLYLTPNNHRDCDCCIIS